MPTPRIEHRSRAATSRLPLRACALGLALFALTAGGAAAQLSGAVSFVVLRVTFSDFGTGTRFTTAEAQSDFGKIATLWGDQSSYGNIQVQYQFAGPYQVASPSATYLDQESGQSSSTGAIVQLIEDAVAASPKTIDWTHVYGVVVLFGDTRATGFYRGITLPGTTSISPPAGGSFDVHGSIVGESPAEDVARTWGRWAHEMGHQMQANPGNPWHPSGYNSDFEQMDTEYPAQSGMFNKQANMAYPGWMPAGKYKTASPPQGVSVGLLAEERPPGQEPDFQAIKAFLTFGAPKLYYLVSVRHHTLGDEVATTHGPHGIPDEGVLIERVVEGGDPAIDDCSPNGCFRWVDVRGNGGDPATLWHAGDTYESAADGIFISVRSKADDDHYVVTVAYSDRNGQPDVGINSWLQPPANSYETTDIWVDSPVNGYGTFRYGTWSDLMGGTVPVGNGDDPAVGQTNRLYARVRNYGSVAATDVVVHFDITDPPGLGINGSNGFKMLGTVDKTQFPALGLLAPGQSTDVYLEWTPDFALTPDQIQQGRFFFHTCVRVRIDHVAGETFFANQDGDGQQENIEYFEAATPGAPGAPGDPNTNVIHLRNDSPAVGKQFYLTVGREQLPKSWTVVINHGDPVVQLGPAEMRDIPVTITQTQAETVGSRHSIRVFASSRQTLRNAQRPNDLHEHFQPLGGVQFQVAVLRKTMLHCSLSNGRIQGTLTGLDGKDSAVPVYVSGVDASGRFLPGVGSLGKACNGEVAALVPRLANGAPVERAVCLYAGSQLSSAAGSPIFAIDPSAVGPAASPNPGVADCGEAPSGKTPKERPVFFGAAAGGDWPVGRLRERFDPGFRFSVQLEKQLTPSLRMGPEVGYHQFALKPGQSAADLGVTDVSALARFLVTPSPSTIHLFLLGGPGLYHGSAGWVGGGQLGGGLEATAAPGVLLTIGTAYHRTAASATQPKINLGWLDGYIGLSFRIF